MNVFNIQFDAKVSYINTPSQRNCKQLQPLKTATLPLQVALFTRSKSPSTAAEDCHQLEREPALTHFQMLQIHNTQKSFDPAQLYELCTTAFSFTDSTVLLAQCKPDSTLTDKKGNTKTFFQRLNLCVERTQSCCLGADTRRKIVAHMWSSAHKAFDVTFRSFEKNQHLLTNLCFLPHILPWTIVSSWANYQQWLSSDCTKNSKYWKRSLSEVQVFLMKRCSRADRYGLSLTC